ncbi:ly6/PLAUR domain-containing protein 6B isoform X2 [Protopterus annectens]|nr:ly6/PLAUR domain-containing protein 6B isoform X2 [Protopterus annectens]
MLIHHLPSVLFLQILLVLGNWVCARNINFYNVRLPLDPTPFPNSFKCFTCENALNNYECNRWAEDKWCPQNTEFCLTIHHLTSHDRSKSVTKRCATREECRFVGCQHRREFGHMECISCCEGMICNVEVPTNHTNAVFAVMKSHRPSSGHKRTFSYLLLFLSVLSNLI